MKYDDIQVFYDDPFVFFDMDPVEIERKKKMAAKIKLDHQDMSNLPCISRMKEIVVASTGNATFAAIAAKVTAFGTKVADYETKNTAFDTGEEAQKTKMTQRDDARAEAEEAGRTLATAAEGETTDAALLQLGGWHIRADRAPVGPMPAPQNATGTGGDMDGTVDLHWDPIKGSQMFLGEKSLDGINWTEFYMNTQSSTTATGLVSGTEYHFRFRAKGSQGLGPWSQIVRKRAT